TTNSTEVTAILGLRTTNTNRSFTYQQTVTTDSSGNFNITVPYPTSDNVTVSEGGTDPAVVANGNYTVYTGTGRLPEEIGSAQVSERDIYFGNEVRVELQEFNLPTRNTSSTSGNSSGSESGG
ncbi:MAG: oligosaccharyl transferase, archaeosortase A system-associated, partial [Halobacteria archaeon]|nr:oligosaccharyl transferase, archaeosortase A system-associated [Halobacteria archaeon]